MSEKKVTIDETQNKSSDGAQSSAARSNVSQQEHHTNVFRQLFATLEAEHRKIRDLEQRRLQLTEEMQTLRDMLQNANTRLRESTETGASTSTAPREERSAVPPKNQQKNQNLKRNDKNRKITPRPVSASGSQMLGQILDSDVRPQTQAELDEILASLPALFQMIDHQEEPESLSLSDFSSPSSSFEHLLHLPPNPPPSESEFFDFDAPTPFNNFTPIELINPNPQENFMLTPNASFLYDLDNIPNFVRTPTPPTENTLWQISMAAVPAVNQTVLQDITNKTELLKTDFRHRQQ